MSAATCELARYSNGAARCDQPPTHRVDTLFTGGDSYELCRQHAADAMTGQHRHPARPGEAVTVTPGLGA